MSHINITGFMKSWNFQYLENIITVTQSIKDIWVLRKNYISEPLAVNEGQHQGKCISQFINTRSYL